MPQWLATGNGNHWAVKTGRLYYVTEWIDGSKLSDNEQDYEQLGCMLARLHLISRRRLSASFSMNEIEGLWHQNRIFAGHLKVVGKAHHGTAKWFREHGEQCLSLAEEAWRTFRQPDVLSLLRNEKSSLIHGDVTKPNIIVGLDGVYLVDWELARRGSSYYEVAKTLNNVSGFSVPLIKAFLAGYEREWPFVREERMIIASLCRLPREAWIAARLLRLGRKAPILTILQQSWPDRLEAIQWLDQWAGEEIQTNETRDSQFPAEGEAGYAVNG
jgi:Ser/Thr protein kinase RdoA (MazF antagonist)